MSSLSLSSAADHTLRSRRVLVDGALRPAIVRLRDGRIASVEAWEGSAANVRDFGDAVIMPGLVDTHVHVNEPGRTDWEGFRTATRAAAAGGVTTLLDMPLNSIPATTTPAALEAKRRAAVDQCWVNVGFLGGVVPGNTDELPALWARGVFGFKCFLAPSGVEEFPMVGAEDLRTALFALARLGAPLMVHAELPQYLETPSGDPRRYASYLASRPVRAETEAIHLVVRLAEESRARVHVVHMSAAESIAVLRRARAHGVRVSAETCPHYLTFAAEEIADGATELKCAPPIRASLHREALWQALATGDLDVVVTDHSPCPPELKAKRSGDFFAAWGGISSLQLGLSAVWDGARTRGHAIPRIAEWMSAAPARLVAGGLDTRKGAITPGYDADLVVWDPEATLVVREVELLHRHRLTPYLGRSLRGRVTATFVGGRVAYIDGEVSELPVGRILTRDER
jgi:allantoinase